MGWNSGPDFIESKTTKGILYSDIDSGKVSHEWEENKMSGGGSVPTGVMTLKEWVENTEMVEVGKYVKSKLKKPETQIYVIGEEDDYAVKIDTDWKEDKPLTDEEGSEHTLYIGKGVVKVETDVLKSFLPSEFTNTFFTKDANFKITKN